MIILLLIILICTFFISYYFVKFIINIALKLNIVDYPNEEVITHIKTTPLLGGSFLVFVLLIGIALAYLYKLNWGILGFLSILILGFYKDLKKPVPVFIQLIFQGLAVCLLLWESGKLLNLFDLYPVDFVMTFFICLWIINSWNFLDVVDGLAGGIAVIASFLFMIIWVITGNIIKAVMAAGLTGSALGFLVHNFPPARIFMGDLGSYGIGFLFSSFILLANNDRKIVLAGLVILTVPLFDVIFAIVMRIMDGCSPFTGRGIDHISLKLLNAGWSTLNIIMTAYLITVAIGVASLLILHQSILN